MARPWARGHAQGDGSEERDGVRKSRKARGQGWGTWACRRLALLGASALSVCTHALMQGLLYNVGDAQEKLSEYISIAQRSGSSIPSGLLDSGGVLKGVDGPGEKANAFGPSPLG